LEIFFLTIGSLTISIIPETFWGSLSVVNEFVTPDSVVEALVTLLCSIELNVCGLLGVKTDIVDFSLSVSK
jgi:hypothetical protein